MNYEIAMKWCEALKSGKYKQGKSVLRNCNDEYCCLGVLCDISEQGKWDGSLYLSHECYLPPKVRNWANIKTHWGLIESQSKSLVYLNDLKVSFDIIADYIEKYWEEI